MEISGRKIILTVFIILVLAIFMWVFYESNFSARKGEELRNQSELMLGFTLPSWGFFKGYEDASGFDVVWYLNMMNRHAIYLFISENGERQSLTDMLHQLESRNRANEEESAGEWTRFIPRMEGAADLSTSFKTMKASYINLIGEEYDLPGIMAEFELHQRAVTLLAYSSNFKPKIVQKFLRRLHKQSRLFTDKDYNEIAEKAETSETFYESGPLHWRETLVYGIRHGVSLEYYQNGDLKREVPYRVSQKHGVEKEYYEGGQLKRESQWEHGLLDGISKGYYETGPLREEMFYKMGKLEGPGKFYYKSGEFAREVTYKNGVQDGLENTYYPNGNLAGEAEFKDGMLAGGGLKKYDAAGRLREEKACAMGVCIHTEYYANGTAKHRWRYVNDLLNGVSLTYDENGMLRAEQNYRDGELNGVSREYDETGQVTGEETYAEGVKKA